MGTKRVNSKMSIRWFELLCACRCRLEKRFLLSIFFWEIWIPSKLEPINLEIDSNFLEACHHVICKAIVPVMFGKKLHKRKCNKSKLESKNENEHFFFLRKQKKTFWSCYCEYPRKIEENRVECDILYQIISRRFIEYLFCHLKIGLENQE